MVHILKPTLVYGYKSIGLLWICQLLSCSGHCLSLQRKGRMSFVLFILSLSPSLSSPKKWGVGIGCCDILFYWSNQRQENIEKHRKGCQIIWALRLPDMQGPWLPISDCLICRDPLSPSTKCKTPEFMGLLPFYHLCMENVLNKLECIKVLQNPWACRNQGQLTITGNMHIHFKQKNVPSSSLIRFSPRSIELISRSSGCLPLWLAANRHITNATKALPFPTQVWSIL